jgi:dihydropteroate synthase
LLRFARNDKSSVLRVASGLLLNDFMTAYIAPILTVRDRPFAWGARTYIVGIVNVSPESFSGDGVADPDAAVAQAKRMAAEGADVIDVGGQSTRPGFEELSVAEEVSRLVPSVRAIVSAIKLPVSIDTYRAEVARAALDAGAHIVNDIWGLRRDPAMAPLVAERGVPAIVMHNQRGRQFRDVIGDIRAGFEASFSIAAEAGVPREHLILDPGFGFGWTVEQNLEMLRRLGELRDFGLPLLIGTSRKSTIGAVLDRPEGERLAGTAATVAIAIANGAGLVRVHDVAQMVAVCRMTDAIVRGR